MKLTSMLYVAVSLGAFISYGQDDSQRYKTGQIKVGDRVLADPIRLHKPDTCTVIGTAELTGPLWK